MLNALFEASLYLLVGVPALYGIGWFWGNAVTGFYLDAKHLFRRGKQ